jgi:hypothetical protein
MQLHDFLFQQTQAPFGVTRRRWPARQRNQLCFRRAIKYPWPGRFGIVFAGQHRLETFLDKSPSRSFDRGDARIQRLGDPAIAPPFASFRNIRFQQNARLRNKLCRAPAPADKLIELVPFLLAQIHDIFLDDTLSCRHESSPSPPRNDMDSESPIKRNDARH